MDGWMDVDVDAVRACVDRVSIDRSRVGSRRHPIATRYRSNSTHRARSHPSTTARISRARARARASFLHTAHFLENVCPSRVLLRLPRRRLQGDQDPSTYCVARFVAASVARGRRRVGASAREDVIPTTTAHRQRARDTIVASARLTTTTRRRIARDGGADARANFDSFSRACARGWACVARDASSRGCGRSYRRCGWISRVESRVDNGQGEDISRMRGGRVSWIGFDGDYACANTDG